MVADKIDSELEFKRLSDRIKKNLADPEEYETYLNFVSEKSGNRDLVDSVKTKLRSEGFYSFDDYKKARDKARSYEEKNKTEAVVLGAILGLGLALILTGLLGDKK